MFGGVIANPSSKVAKRPVEGLFKSHKIEANRCPGVFEKLANATTQNFFSKKM